MEDQETSSEGWIVADIFKLMLITVKNNTVSMALIFIVYAAAAAALNLIFGAASQGFEGFIRVILLSLIMFSLISVLRPIFKGKKFGFKYIFPGWNFFGKVILFFIFVIVLSLILKLTFFIFSVFCGYFIKSIFGRLISPDTIYFIFAAAVMIILLLTAYFSFCFLAFSGKNGFGESLSTAMKIFTENKLIVFFVFSALAAAATFIMSSYVVPLISLHAGSDLASLKKVRELYGFMTTTFAVISSGVMPLYWMFLMSVYFTLGHEGDVVKELRTGHYASHFEEETGPQESPREEDEFDNFSLSNAFYFSWGIYKKIFVKLTSGILAVYAVFIFICAIAFFALRQSSVLPDVFAGKYPSLDKMFVFVAAAAIVYYILMFFYFSYARGFFRGKGMDFKNFFPLPKINLRFFAFMAFISAFILSIPFILEKAGLLLQFFIKSFNFPFASLIAGLSLIFAVIAVYALVSLFYVPFFILDGHTFSDSLTTCTQMMGGQKMAFICVLFVLVLINIIGHALIAGWIFTVPFSVLVLMQIYVTISAGYSSYQEDVVNYE
ncbi:MAG: hypothetical protein FWH43_00945 [Endomicrobia bacterium]|nr:hypothetical protein [Endomicrobiia bacterium]